jgi:hypothetical protein
MKNDKIKNKKKKEPELKQTEAEKIAVQIANDARLSSSTEWKINEPAKSPATVKTPTTIAMLINGSLEAQELAKAAALCKATLILKELNDELKDVKIPVLVYHWFTKPTIKYVPVPLQLLNKPGRELEIMLTFPNDSKDPESPSFPNCIWRETNQPDYAPIANYLALKIARYCVYTHERFEYLTHH